MSVEPASGRVPLPCDEILYRLLLKRAWLDPDGKGILPEAFFRRPDEEGLSVFIKTKCSLDEARGMMNRVRGVGSLHTGRVHDINLKVMSDPIDPRHAEIMGVPLPDEDEDMANYYADLLAEQARVAWRA